MRIGIFGGTFNPPHEGHKKLALEFSGRLSLDLILVIPTCSPPHKTAHSLASASDRLEMCRLCFEDEHTTFIVSNIEICRRGKSYTVDTLKQIKILHPRDELFFIMGSDMLLSFHEWREPERILSMATICAASRNDADAQRLHGYIGAHFPDEADRFIIIDFDPIEVSSTQIRQSIAEGEGTRFLNKKVETYIKQKGLYTDAMD